MNQFDKLVALADHLEYLSIRNEDYDFTKPFHISINALKQYGLSKKEKDKLFKSSLKGKEATKEVVTNIRNFITSQITFKL